MIVKTRREYFGGVIFFEKPGFVGYVNNPMADSLGIRKNPSAVYKENVFSAPLDAHFAVTTRCNMYCRGCYNTARGDLAEDIDFEKAKRIIDNLSKLGVLSVSFGGGEPTLYPNIIELAEYARSRRILPNMTTNGLTMTAEFAKKCKVFGNVHFSIHKPSDVETAFNAAKIFKKQTGKKAGLNVLITTEMLPILENTVKNAPRSDFNKILFLRYKETAKNAGVHGLNADDLMQSALLKIKKLSVRTGMMFLYDCSALQEIAAMGLIKPKLLYKADANGCMGGNAYIAIDVHGRFKPCSFWNETFGDAETLSFETWQSNEKLQEFRNFRKSAKCSQCGYFSVCNGGCRLKYLTCNAK